MAFTDDFNAGSVTNLEDWTPSGGTAWTLGGGATGAFVAHNTNGACRAASSTPSYYTCDDQGSADHYIAFRSKYFSTLLSNLYACVRLVDSSNFIAWRLVGTGAAGRRLSKNVAGTITDLITSQGVDEEWIKVEAEGTTIRFYQGGTGGVPSWTQVGTDQTVSDHSTETSQGVAVVGSFSSVDWIDDFEAAALASGVTGTITITLENFAIAFSGTTTVLGSMANQLENVTTAFVGASTVTGTVGNTLEDATTDFQGTAGSAGPEGTIALNLEDSTASLVGTTAIVGTIGTTLEDNTAALTGTTTVVGTIANVLDDVVTFFYGFPGVQGAVARLRTLIGTGT